MNTKTMGTAALALATAVGLASGAFADAEPAYHALYDCLVTDGSGYIVTGYVPNHRRTLVEISAKATKKLDGVALVCANGYVSGGKDYGSTYYGHFDNDLTFQNVSEDVQVCPGGVKAPAVNTPFVIRYFRNSVAVSYDNGATFTTYDGGNPDETYPDGSAGGKMMLFGSMCPKIGERFQGYIYSVKVWEISPDNTETNVVMDLVPALSKDNFKTLYDTVGKKCLEPTNGRGFLLTPVENVMSWSGAGENTNFSNPENWTNGIAPCAGDAYLFADADALAGNRRVHFDLPSSETAPLMQDFHCSGNYTFSSDSPVWATLAGLKEGFYPAVSRSRTEITGPNTEMRFFPIGSANTYCVVSADATLLVTDGAKAYVENLTWANKANPSMVVSNANSLLSFNIDKTSTGSNPTFAAYDGGKMTCTKIATTSSSLGGRSPTFIADGAKSVLDMAPVKVLSGKITIKSTNGGSVKLNAFTNTGTAGDITCTDDSTIELSGAVYYPKSDQSCASTLTLSGANPKITIADQSTFGRNDASASLRLNLTPELSWGSGARIADTKTGSTTGKMTFYKGIKYTVDVTAFTNYYGKMSMTLAQAGNSLSYTEPSAGGIVTNGIGKANCGVDIRKDGKLLILDVTSTNVPEGKVAAINNSSKFFDALPAAVAAAADGETVMVFDDMAVTGSLIAAEGCAVTVDAPKPVVITLTGKVGDGVTFGSNVTVKKMCMTMYLR